MRLSLSILLFLTFHLYGVERPIEGGVSPDGRYAFFLVGKAEFPLDDNPEDHAYDVVFRDQRTKRTQTLDAGPQGFCTFQGSEDPVNSQAWWSPDGRFVALCFRTSRHSREPYLYCLVGGLLQVAQLPDYNTFIYQRLGVKKGDRAYVRCPIAWSDRRTLRMLAYGDSHECEITLRVEKKLWGAPKVTILKVTKGEPLEG